jgi:hypothetical protein
MKMYEENENIVKWDHRLHHEPPIYYNKMCDCTLPNTPEDPFFTLVYVTYV